MNNNRIKISITSIGKNSSPIHETEEFVITINDNKSNEFIWNDSWNSTGTGYFVVISDEQIKLTMKVEHVEPFIQGT